MLCLWMIAIMQKTQTFKSLYDVKMFVANSAGLDFHSYLDLKDAEDNTVVRGGY